MDNYEDGEFLPKVIQSLLLREHLKVKTCVNCLQAASLKCTRCRCQYYCSANCQREHFERHKKNCKSISKARKKIDTLMDGVFVGSGQLSAKLKVTVLKINLADLLVTVAYNECDTIAHGRVFYSEALRLYAHPLIGDVWLECLGHNKFFSFLDERLMLMVIACGGDTSELEPVFMNCGGYKVNANQEIYSAGMEDLVNCNTHRAYYLKRHVLTQCLRDCYQWHFFWLLAYVMKMSKYRENVGRLDAFRSALNELLLDDDNVQGGLPGDEDIVEHISKYLIGDKEDYFTTVLPNNIHKAIELIEKEKEGLLVHLKHAESFTRELAPDLFPGLGSALNGELQLTPMDISMMLSEISLGGGAPPECWLIFQKCIFESFGGSEIVQEFIEG